MVSGIALHIYLSEMEYVSFCFTSEILEVLLRVVMEDGKKKSIDLNSRKVQSCILLKEME